MISEDDALLYAFRRNAFVAASAGTGKTHRLTSLYVLLTLGLTSMGASAENERAAPILPSRILATTFSRAAASEIRARIERALRAVAAGDAPPALGEVIAHRLAILGAAAPSGATVVERARAAIDDLPRAQIDTLHGVAHHLVRAHALALGVSPGASIVDEDEGREIIGAAVDGVLAAALADAPTRAAGQALLRSTGGLDALRVASARLFERLDEDGLSVDALASPDHEAEARGLLHELATVASACAANSGSRALGAAARALVASSPSGECAPNLDDATRARVVDLFVQRKPGGASATPADDAFDSFRKRFGSGSNRERAHRLVAFVDAASGLVERERGIVDILSRIHSAIAIERRRRDVLSFGDVLRIARQGLVGSSRISREARRSFDALFVDEFQDTSMVQRDLVFLLRETERSFAQRVGRGAPGADDIEGHGLFVVGDRKQSIYAFRGADVTVFSSVAVELAGEPAARALGLDASAARPADRAVADFVSLRTSHRSGEAILAFVNALARADFRALGADLAYADAEELVPATSSSSEVVVVRGDGTPLPIDLENFMPQEALAAMFASDAHAAGFAFRDIAILARRRSTLPLVEHALERAGLPFVVAGRGLYETREVRDVAALLRLLCDPRDRHAAAIVLRGPVVAVSDTSLVELLGDRARDLDLVSGDGRGPRLREGEEAARLKTFRGRFSRARAHLLRSAPGAAIREAIRVFDLDRIVAAMPRARIRLGNLERIAEIADAHGGSTAAFSRWLDRQIAEDIDEPEAVVFSEEDDAIRLTTIHGSKGLDFEAVIVVDLDAAATGRVGAIGYRKAPDGRSATLVVRHRGAGGVRLRSRVLDAATRDAAAQDAAERRRLSYVGITRAKRLLALVEPDGAPVAGSLHHTLRLEMERGAPLGVRVVTASELASQSLRSADRVAKVELGRPRSLPVEVAVHRSTLATTPLSTLRDCERRFQLRYVLGLTEPVQSGQLDLFDESGPDRDERRPADGDEPDPRVLGRAAHGVLERWPLDRWGMPTSEQDVGDALRAAGVDSPELASRLGRILSSRWARGVGEGAARGDVLVEREVDVVRDLTTPDGAFTFSLRGTCDLVLTWLADGAPRRVDVIDYKLRRPVSSLERYAFQLRAYALALATRCGAVRAGVLFLEGGDAPTWLGDDGSGPAIPDHEHARFAAELLDLARRAANARAHDDYRAEQAAHCRAISCGFIVACHPRA